jgi:hypothetical protein
MTDQNLVTKKLGLKLNSRLRKLCWTRIEYGHNVNLSISFEIENMRGGFRIVPEEEFALDDFRANTKLKRNVGVFGEGDPRPVIDALINRYPDATIMMRKDPSKKRTRKTKARG